MAKDKSKKSTAASDDFAKPSDAPAGGDGWKITDDANRGKLMIITPLREKDVEDTFSKEPGATKSVIVADVVVVNEKKPEKSEEHTDVYIFSGYLKGALRGYIGERRVLGRLTNTEDTSKKQDRGNYYWELSDATEKELAIAKAYLASLDPFAAKSPKTDEPKAKKGKKAEPEPEPKAKKKKAKK